MRKTLSTLVVDDLAVDVHGSSTVRHHRAVRRGETGRIGERKGERESDRRGKEEQDAKKYQKDGLRNFAIHIGRVSMT